MRGSAVGLGLAGVGAPVVAQLWDWRAVFLVTAAASGAVAVCLARVPDVRPRLTDPILRVTRAALRIRPVQLLMALVACEGFLFTGLLTVLPSLLQLHGTRLTIAGGVTVTFPAAVVLIGLWPRRDRLPPALLVLIGGAAGVLAYGSVLLDRGPVGAVATCFLLGTSWALMHATLQVWITRATGDTLRAAAVSVFAVSLFAGGALAVPVGTHLFTHGRETAPLLSGAIGAALLTAVATWAGRTGRTVQQEDPRPTRAGSCSRARPRTPRAARWRR
jgi:predicted MFS family arabinose efflux permease